LSATAFPNPSDGNFAIEITSNKNGPVSIEIENAIGKKVFGKDAMVINGKNIIPVNGQLAAGIYIYRIKTDNAISEGKIVVK